MRSLLARNYRSTANHQVTRHPVKIAINGFGRIGRSLLRAVYEHPQQSRMRVVAINELADIEAMAHLLKYDTTHGRFSQKVSVAPNQLWVARDAIRVTHEPDPTRIDWASVSPDIILDCTGFYQRAQAEQQLAQGVARILYSHPATNDVDDTIIYGVNHHRISADARVLSNGSCTTNCIVPVIEQLDQAFGIDSGTITTIHSSMHDQQVIDAYHSDLRRTRAASQSIIPVDTKLALGIERILPRFAGRFEAIAVRVPTINVTAMDLSVRLNTPVSVADVNQRLRTAASESLAGILDYTEAPLVSVDFNHDPHSAIVDGTQTRVSHRHLTKTLVWCDNEWGFANRMLDSAMYLTDTHPLTTMSN